MWTGLLWPGLVTTGVEFDESQITYFESGIFVSLSQIRSFGDLFRVCVWYFCFSLQIMKLVKKNILNLSLFSSCKSVYIFANHYILKSWSGKCLNTYMMVDSKYDNLTWSPVWWWVQIGGGGSMGRKLCVTKKGIKDANMHQSKLLASQSGPVGLLYLLLKPVELRA